MPEGSRQSFSSYVETRHLIQTTSEWSGTPLRLSGKESGLSRTVSLQVSCPEKKQVCNTTRQFGESKMLHRIRQQCVNNTVFNIAACQPSTTRKNASFVEEHTLPRVIDPFFWSPLWTDRRQSGIMQKSLEMNICYTWFVVLTRSAMKWWQTIFSTTVSALTPTWWQGVFVHRRRHAQVLTQVHIWYWPSWYHTQMILSSIDGVIFLVTVLSDGFAKFLEIHGVDNVHPYWSQSWDEGFILWGITERDLQPVHPPGMADNGCHPRGGWAWPGACQSQAAWTSSQPYPHADSSGLCLPTKWPQGWTIHTVCIWQPWFQRVHKGWTNTAFHLKESHLSLKDRQRSRSLVGVEMEPKLPVCFAETLDHLSTVWHLVDVCPTVGGSKTKLYCSNMKFIPGIFVYLIPPHQLWWVVIISFPSHQRTLRWMSRQFSTISRHFYKTRPRVHYHHMWSSNLLSSTGSAKEEP